MRAALSLLDYDDDHLPEILVGVNNVQDLDSALWAYVSHADSGFGPNGEHASGLGAEATMTGTAPRYIGR